MSDAPFDGLPRETLDYLAALDEHNEKPWFEAHRADYQRLYVDAGVALAAALGPRLVELEPGLDFDARVGGTVMRIHRDVRFSADKTPYKAHLDLWFWKGERKGWASPGFFLRLTPRELILGAGMHRFERGQLDAYRAAVVADGPGGELQALGERLTEAGYELPEPARKRVPRGFDPAHPRAAWLLLDGLHALWQGPPPDELFTAAAADWCAGRCRALQPVNAWIAANVSG